MSTKDAYVLLKYLYSIISTKYAYLLLKYLYSIISTMRPTTPYTMSREKRSSRPSTCDVTEDVT